MCFSSVDPLFHYLCHCEKASWILSLKRQSYREVHKSSQVNREWGSSLPSTFSSCGSLLLKLFVSSLHAIPLPPKWSVNVVPSPTTLLPKFPLHTGTQLSLLLEFTWNELTFSLSPGLWSWVFLHYFLTLSNSVTKISLDRFICKTIVSCLPGSQDAFVCSFLLFWCSCLFILALLCSDSCYSFSFCSPCIFPPSPSASYICFSLSH